MTFAEFKTLIEGHSLKVKDESIRDLNAALYQAVLTNSKDGQKFYRQEMKRLAGSSEPTLTPEQMRERHEALVAKLGRTIDA